MATQGSGDLIEKLLDSDVELDSLKLDDLPAEDLVYALRALRAHVLMLTSMVGILSDQIRLVDAFARPTTKRIFYAPPRSRTIQ